MKLSTATYRLQFSSEFSFADLQENLDYLEDLGISTIYAAPILQARKGSTHGYDNINPFEINKEIGTLEEFRKIKKELNNKNMEWLQDIVPNHMAFDGKNVWLKNIFELGPNSEFYHNFDIDWNYKGLGKVMAPFLGTPLEEVLQKKEIKLKYDKSGFSINYFNQSYPASVRSYPQILSSAEMENWKRKFQNFEGNSAHWEDLKTSFYLDFQENEYLNKNLKSIILNINNSEGKLKNILELQYFLPVHWKATEKEINYRRFFTINDLICLQMEDPKVFESYHEFIRELYENELIDGLRIDHIDGLFNPKEYLENLKEMLGKDLYVVVEKILEKEEKLPQNWPMQGSSGYEFLAQVNQLFTQKESENHFLSAYKKIAPEFSDYEKLIFEKKLFILKERMGGEFYNLWQLLKNNDLLPENRNQENLKEAFSAFLAGFPVYRIYPQKFPLNNIEQDVIKTACKTAIKYFPKQEKELAFFKSLFLGEAKKDIEKMLFFLQRCQQFTGPLAAKGAEDTGFYIYNRLISHNEVGDSPEYFGISVDEFHQKMLQRQKDFPHSLNATATHDTKRGEDARMRLNVLSEIPKEWFEKVNEWRKINKESRKNQAVPDANEEYFIYQTILAAFPFEENPTGNFLSRTTEYLQKVLREAKIHSNWAQPDTKYESAVFDFVSEILKNKEFRNSFDPFQHKIAFYGAIKSLDQCLLKITVPGIPDIYQGTELWDLSYVDPDNRRSVNYSNRSKFVSDFELFSSYNLNNKLNQLKNEFSSGKLKLFCLQKSLKFRRDNPKIFEEGEYIPVPVSGENAEHFICFARKNQEDWILIIVPVLVTELFKSDSFVPKPKMLSAIKISLPKEAPQEWKNIFTGEIYNFEVGVDLEKVFKNLPVALLRNSTTTIKEN